MTFTSQHGEDIWISEHWTETGLPEVGFFVEFGAADGVTFSNTYWLEKTKGWAGLLIEADPRHIIRDRTAIIERVAVGPEGIASFGLESEPMLSGVMRPSEKRMEVQSVPLSAILERNHIDRVDLLSIDTEGSELEAWGTLDLSRWRPTIVIMEMVTWGMPSRRIEIDKTMASCRYREVHRTAYNIIFKCAL